MLQCMPLGLEQCLARMMLSIRKEAKGWRYRHRLHLGQVQGRLAYPRPPCCPRLLFASKYSQNQAKKRALNLIYKKNGRCVNILRQPIYNSVLGRNTGGGVMEDGNDTTIVDASNTTTYRY